MLHTLKHFATICVTITSTTGADRAVLFPRMEHQGGVFGFGGGKAVKSNFSLNIPDEIKVRKIVALSLQSYNTFTIKALN